MVGKSGDEDLAEGGEGRVDFSKYDPIDNPYNSGATNGEGDAVDKKDGGDIGGMSWKVPVGITLVALAFPMGIGMFAVGTQSMNMMGLVYMPLGSFALFMGGGIWLILSSKS